MTPEQWVAVGLSAELDQMDALIADIRVNAIDRVRAALEVRLDEYEDRIAAVRAGLAS